MYSQRETKSDTSATSYPDYVAIQLCHHCHPTVSPSACLFTATSHYAELCVQDVPFKHLSKKTDNTAQVWHYAIKHNMRAAESK